ncbi:hypothetical protein HK405_007814 [Cladochytrium tenue]|nr:hypothetical protein HK405_007814 [Cladochytrium tenue]
MSRRQPQPDPNERNEVGNAPLHLAALAGDATLAASILKNGKANVNLQDVESGYTALHKALSANDRLAPERVEVYTKPQRVTLSNLRDFNLPISTASVSKYHMLVVAGGRVFAHGFGSGGRLGLGHEETVFTPTAISGIAGEVIHVACGYDHSVAVNKGGTVWTWGRNEHGQLGYPSSVESPLQISPRKVTVSSQSFIHEIAVTNHATALLMTNSEIHVLAGFQTRRVILPVTPPPRGIVFYRIESPKGPVRAKKIKAGNHQFCALAETGDVYLWTPPAPPTPSLSNSDPRVVAGVELAALKLQQEFPQTRPKRIWHTRLPGNEASDVSVGADSSVLVLTEAGNVFIGQRRGGQAVSEGSEQSMFKFKRVPNLGSVCQVFSGASGAFAAVRQDEFPQLPPEHTLPLGSELGTMRQNFPTALLRRDPAISVSSELDSVTDVILLIAEPKSGSDVSTFETGFNAHGCVLQARSRFFRTALPDSGTNYADAKKNNDTSVEFMKVSLGAGASRKSSLIDVIRFPFVTMPEVMDAALKLMYTGNVPIELASRIFNSPAKTELQLLLKLLNIDGTPHHALSMDAAGWTLRIQDVYISSTGQSQTFVEVDLSHMRTEVVRVVLRWVYGESEVKALIGDLERPTFWSYFDLLVECLGVANELALDGFKTILADVLFGVVDIHNASLLLDIADMYDVPRLKRLCLELLCWNLDAALEMNLLDNVSPELIESIQKTLVEKQKFKFPLTRGADGYFAKVRARAKDEAKEQKQRRREFRREQRLSLESMSPVASPSGNAASLSRGATFADSLLGTSYLSSSSSSTSSSLVSELKSPTATPARHPAQLSSSVEQHDAGLEGREPAKSVLIAPETPLPGERRSMQTDGIFEIELEDAKGGAMMNAASARPISQTGKEAEGDPGQARGSDNRRVKKKAWAKAGLGPETSAPPSTPRPTIKSEVVSVADGLPASPILFAKSWNYAAESTGKLSLLDIMKETEVAKDKTRKLSGRQSFTTPSAKTTHTPPATPRGLPSHTSEPPPPPASSFAATITVKTSTGKSQRERKREKPGAAVAHDTTTGGAAGTGSPVADKAWTSAPSAGGGVPAKPSQTTVGAVAAAWGATPVAAATTGAPQTLVDFRSIQNEQENSERRRAGASASAGAVVPPTYLNRVPMGEGSWKGPLGSALFSSKSPAATGSRTLPQQPWATPSKIGQAPATSSTPPPPLPLSLGGPDAGTALQGGASRGKGGSKEELPHAPLGKAAKSVLPASTVTATAAMPSSSSSASSSFLSIQEDQRRAEERVRRQRERDRRKPMVQIQVEERAMAEIREFYRMTSAPEEGEWFGLAFVARGGDDR